MPLVRGCSSSPKRLSWSGWAGADVAKAARRMQRRVPGCGFAVVAVSGTLSASVAESLACAGCRMRWRRSC